MSFLSNATIQNALPAGVIFPFAGSTAPDGWLLCGGQAVSRTVYSRLFTQLSTTYGIGDGSTTFNLPDLRGRVAAGKDNMNGSSANRLTSGGSGIAGTTLGAVGGEQTNTLSLAQLPAHNHGGGNHQHPMNFSIASGTTTQISTVQRSSNLAYGFIYDSGTILNTEGSGSGHNNTQPTLILNYIIKI